MINDIFQRIAVLVILLLFGVFSLSGQTSGTAFRVEEVLSGLETPWALAFLPDGAALITLKGGGLVYARGSETTAAQGLPPIRSSGQGGLLDLALHPRFEENGFVYFTFSEGPAGRQGTSVARGVFTSSPSPRISEWRVIFSGNNVTGGGLHFGSRLAFG
ncbi:MAG: PQQ-dependent sugar dehydrogenase, partial [Spirochaetales bacterium]|nr:PQQ-dependent sugar dehydrogenase [Spirochaetales bacterium]